MATRKFLYVDANGDYLESTGAYETSDYISTSAGAGDAGKPIVLDAGGKIDASMIEASDIDHGSLSGLGDDDHTQYTLADGTRAFTGDQSMGSNKLTNLADGTASSDAVNKGQLDAAVSGLQDFRESVIDKDLLTPPGSPTTGDRYVIGQPTDTATGAWAGNEGKITEWDGSAWVFEANPDEGTYVYVEDENAAYIFNNNVFASGTWVLFSAGVYTASLGVELVGSDFRLDLLASGGLKLTGNEVGVEPNDFAGTGLQDDGSDNLEIDFADTATEMGTSRAVAASDLSSNGANQGAKILGADPTTIAVSSATTIQGILEDIDNFIAAPGTEFTVDGTGVTAGDLLFISANDTVSTYGTISAVENVIGVAATTEAAAGTVKVLRDQQVITGVLTGATAGDKYYWNGSAFTTTIPTGSGNRVYQAGYAVNATDLYIDVDFVKKNS